MAEEKKMEKKERKSVIDLFMKGCYDGFNIGIKNIMPAMILGYTLVYILQATGLMELTGKFLSHFVIPVADAIMLPVAIVSFILMATGMVRLKIIDAKEERNRLEGNEVEG